MEVTVKSIPVHYEEFGAGVPIFMLHGWPVDHRHMVADMEPIFARREGWRRIYPDMPGMGRTPGADWITTQDQMLEIILDFIDQVAPDQRFVVAGTSYGGYLARGILYRRAAQLDGMLLLIPAIETDSARQNYPPQQVLIEDPRFLAALTEEEQDLRTMFVVQSCVELERVRSLIQPAIALADHAFLERLDQHFAFSFAVDELAEPFPAPVTIMAGRQDPWCGYREAWAILDNYPRGTYAVLDRAGHSFDEDRIVFHALAEDWLNRVEEYRARALAASAPLG